MTFTVQLSCGCLLFPPNDSPLAHRLDRIVAFGSGEEIPRRCIVHGHQAVRAAVRPVEVTTRGFGGDQ